MEEGGGIWQDMVGVGRSRCEEVVEYVERLWVLGEMGVCGGVGCVEVVCGR